MGDVQPFNSLTSGTNAMQLKKLSPLAGLLLTALLGACGGGGDDEPPPPAAPPPAAVSVSAVSLSSTSPPAYAENNLKFDGGECSGGTGALTVSWNFGDGTALDSSTTAPHTHKYVEAAVGNKTVTVTCTDSTGKTSSLSKSIDVQTAAMKGFLGKSWTTYRALESNFSPYPVAGITSTGDLYGVWIRRYDLGNYAVAAGLATLDNPNWTLTNTGQSPNGGTPDALYTGTDQSPYNDANGGANGETAPIDLAVSPSGRAIAAWVAGTSPTSLSLYFSTKSSLAATWTPATKLTGVGGAIVSVINDSVKVVVNDDGNGAIAYCTSSGAYAVPVNSNSVNTSGIKLISKQCGDMETTNYGYQRFRAFDVGIDPQSKIYAVGVLDGTASSTSSVAVQTYSGSAWSPIIQRVADNMATPPASLSMSLSPNGVKGQIAWPQKDPNTLKFVVYTSGLQADKTWSTGVYVTSAFTPNTNYTRPLIAVNDAGDVAMTMLVKPDGGTQTVRITNCAACAASGQTWGTTLTQIMTVGYSGATPTSVGQYVALDLAIDQYGTALITNVDYTFNNSWAGTYSKTGVLSNLKRIGPSGNSNNIGSYGQMSFRYQTMRALPNGQAILTTAIYDSLNSAPIKSGFMLLK